MKEYKVDLSGYEWRVREVLSEAVQRHAFKLGYEWLGSGKKEKHTSSPYLFFNKSSTITHFCFEDHRNIKISAADFLALTPEDVKDAPKEPEFKPFDRVLMRDYDDLMWTAHLYSHYEENFTFTHRAISGVGYQQCIPYEGNEHLFGTTEEPK